MDHALECDVDVTRMQFGITRRRISLDRCTAPTWSVRKCVRARS